MKSVLCVDWVTASVVLLFLHYFFLGIVRYVCLSLGTAQNVLILTNEEPGGVNDKAFKWVIYFG